MDDPVRVVFIAQDLIGALACGLADARGTIEDFFPSLVVGDFVDDENVLHGILIEWALGDDSAILGFGPAKNGRNSRLATFVNRLV